MDFNTYSSVSSSYTFSFLHIQELNIEANCLLWYCIVSQVNFLDHRSTLFWNQGKY